MELDQSSLSFIVGQSLYLLEIDPLTGPEDAGYTAREFGMYVLAGIHISSTGHNLTYVQLTQELLDQIKATLDHIAKHGIRGDAVKRAKAIKEGSRPKQQ
jgi:hypothetical protein